MLGKKDPKIIFMGTPEFAAGIFESLLAAGYGIAAVFTQPDKKVGRKQNVVFSPVKKMALEKEIPVFQPEDLRDIGVIREIGEIGGDLIIVAAYGKILPKKILEIPKYGAVNVHASLLPKYRGASPVQSAILEGEKETGVTLMLMNEKMDEGDILAQKKTKIGPDDTARTLLRKLGKLGAEMTVGLIPDWIAGKVKPQKQDGKYATYSRIIRREDGRINWEDPAGAIYRKYKAFTPWPGIYTFFKRKNRALRLKLVAIAMVPDKNTGEKPGKIIKYNRNVAVQTGRGLIRLIKVQPEGKKTMSIEEFMRGNAGLKNVF